MKKIISFLLLLNLVFACKPKSEEVAPVDENGCRVLSYKVTHYDGDVIGSVVCTYNSAKKLVELKSLEMLEKYEYNKKGLRTKKTVTRLSNMYKEAEEEYSYNEKNQLIKEVHRWLDISNGSSKEDYLLYEYHDNGKLSKTEYYKYTAGGLYTRTQYNEQGLMFLEEGPNGRMAKFEYNAAGKVTRTTVSPTPHNNVTVETACEYNAKNLPVKVTIRMDNVITEYINYEYNDKDQQTGVVTTSINGELISKRTTGYNGENYSVANYNNRNELTDRTEYEVLNSRVMKKSYYRKDVFQYSNTYAYDASGNKIRDEEKLSYQANPVIREWAYACD